MKTADLKLSCGCGFVYGVSGVSFQIGTPGSYLKYTPIEPMEDILHAHSLKLYFEPSAVPHGTYNFTVDLTARKKTFNYQNQLYVRVEN